MEMQLSVWKSYGISIKVPRCTVLTVFTALTVLTAVKVFVDVLML